MMISPVRLAWFLIASVLCNPVAAAPPWSSPPATPLITHSVDSAQTTELAGNTRPEVRNPAHDRGVVADDFPLPGLLLQLRRPADREIALAALIDAQTDPASPYYHQWLNADEFGTLFGPAQSDIDTIVAWLQAQGFAVNRVYESGMTIAFSGSAGTVRRAFATEIHAFDVDGSPHYANVSNPRILSALAPAVHGVVALHDFRPRPNSRPRTAPEYSTAGGLRAVVPADLATIYNLNPLFSANNKGSGITIALIEDTDIYALADISTFRTVFGLGTSNFSQVHPGCTDPGAVIGNDSEATLDVEWAAAAAPAATLELVSCANLFDALANLVNANATPPSIISISYGACEAALGASANAFVSSTYQQAVAKGISVFVSSGDEGAAGCFGSDTTQADFGIGVNGLASTPYNVAVGGTDFGDTFAGTTNTYWNTSNTATFGSAKSYINEIPWNDSCASKLIASFEGFATTYGSSGFCNSAAGASFLMTAAGSGGPSGCATGAPSTANVVGGSCAGTAKPSWQSGFLGNPNDHVRDLPDISLFAANGVWEHYYVYCFSDPRPDPNNNNAVYGTACTGAPSGWAGAGGTSFSAPILAGIQALVNQKHAIALAGNPTPTYYKLAAAEYGASGNASCNSSNGNGVGGTCIFYDVTQGDIDVNCAAGTANCYRPSGTHGVLSTSTTSYLPAYGTTTGWDFATGLGSINAANLVANWPAATKLKFTTQPVSGVAGSTLAAIKVSVENVSGSAVVGDTSAVMIKFGSNPGGATLGGTLTVNAVNGVATFSNITINKTGTGYTLVASDGTLTTDTSSAFNITPAAAAKLVFTAQPPASTTSGAGFGATVTIQDSFNNVATGNTSVVALSLTTANGATLSGTKSVNAVNGVATFSGLSIDKVGSYTLTATDGTLTSAVSTSIAIAHGAATKLAFTTQPPASVASAIGFGVVVTVQDAAGDTVTGNSSIVSVALTSPAGATLSGSAAIAASNGAATFNALSVNKIGSYTLTATDGALTAAVSNALTVTAGAAAKLVFTTQPVDITAGSAMNVIVAIEDAAGNIESSDSTTRINLGSSACSNATMASAIVAAGTAQLGNLRFYSVGSGRQVQASSPSLSAGSATFNVSANADLIFADAFAGCLP